jgi:hypothetical protein
MDRLLGGAAGIPLSDSGWASADIADVVAPHEGSEPFLAGLYWWTVVRSPIFRDALHAIGAEGTPSHQILVSHAGRTRFDLLVMVPGFERGPRTLSFRFDQLDAVEVMLRAERSGRGTIGDRLRGRYPELTDRHVREAVKELARAGRFGVVVTGSQPEQDTAVPVPALSVRTAVESVTCATVGAVIARGDRFDVTTALHAVRTPAQEVHVGEHLGLVRVRDPMTDSCLVEVPGPCPYDKMIGLRGPRRTILPGTGEPAFFHRIDEGRVDTEILGVDISALDPQQAFASKVYTKPHTVAGDSGTALIDTSDRIVAFAARRSSAAARITYSIWIWAEQTFAALGVGE